jgi:hypothetical protein
LLVKREHFKPKACDKQSDNVDNKKDERPPELSRELERYINPESPGWQQRYYKTLFDMEIDDERRKQICLNYLEGLEWTFKYYTSGCPDWRWSYKYNYPAYKQYYEICVNPLLLPNFDCSLLSGIYAAKTDIYLFIKMQNKFFWNDLFIKNNVNTPFIIGNIKNKKIILNSPINYNKTYIIKPVVGGLGKNIMDFNDLTISNIDNNNYIIQEKIIQTKIKGHFRINTLFNKKYNEYQLLNMYLCLNDKNKIASNNHNGGKCNEVNIDNDNIRNMYNDDNIYKLSNIFSKNIIDNIIFDALNLHKDLPNHIISVGWDVMIEDNKYFFLEGNVPHSTVFKDDKYFYEKSLNINNLISANIF